MKKKERNKRKKERREDEISDVFVIIFKEKKLQGESKKERKKERKKESYDLWLATSKEKGNESRQVVGKAGLHHNGTVSSVFEFVNLNMYLLNLQEKERKRGKVWVSIF